MSVVINAVIAAMAKYAELCRSREFNSSVVEGLISLGHDAASYLRRTVSDVELSLGIMCLMCLFPVKVLLMCRPSKLLVTQPDCEFSVMCGGKNMCEHGAWHTIDPCYDLEFKS
jgi:hypothetical protein